MGRLKTIVGAISDDVVAALALAAYPPLCPAPNGDAGKILVGTAASYETYAAPRIIFEPMGWKVGMAEFASASASLHTTERRNQNVLRTIKAKDFRFLCRCWGAAPDSHDPCDDYDVTEALADQVMASLQKLLPGAHEVESTGDYPKGGPNIHRLGREVVFGVTVLVPVLDALAPYDLANKTAGQIATVVENLYAPADVVPSGVVKLGPSNGGTPEEP